MKGGNIFSSFLKNNCHIKDWSTRFESDVQALQAVYLSKDQMESVIFCTVVLPGAFHFRRNILFFTMALAADHRCWNDIVWKASMLCPFSEGGWHKNTRKDVALLNLFVKSLQMIAGFDIQILHKLTFYKPFSLSILICRIYYDPLFKSLYRVLWSFLLSIHIIK